MHWRQFPRAALIVAMFCACSKARTNPPEAVPEPPGPATQHDGGHRHAGGHANHGVYQHRFEDAAQWAKMFDDPARDAWQKPDAVIAALQLAPDAVVADIGAGTGYFAVRLAKVVPQGRVLAVDIEADMIRYIQERAEEAGLANVVAVHSTGDSSGLTESINLAFVCDTYHHIADRTRYFAAVRERLAADGRVVIVDFSPDAPADAPGPPVKHRIAAVTVVEELTAAGLQHVSTDTELLPYQYVATFRVQ